MTENHQLVVKLVMLTRYHGISAEILKEDTFADMSVRDTTMRGGRSKTGTERRTNSQNPQRINWTFATITMTLRVHQRCILAPAFCAAIDWITAPMVNKQGILVGYSQFNDHFTQILLVQLPTAAATCLSPFSEADSTLGLEISWTKTKL